MGLGADRRDVGDAVPYGVVRISGVVRRPREGQAPPLRRRTNVGRNQQRDVEDAVPCGILLEIIERE